RAVIPGHALRPASAKDVALVPAAGTDVEGHVLDHAEDRDADLLEHLQPLARVDECDVLRRGHDDGTRDRDLLRERELDIAGAGGQIDDEIVEVAPARVLQELLERLSHHRPAPHHGGVDVDEKPDGDCLQPMALHGLEVLTVFRFGTPGDAEHRRLRGTVDVGIEYAYRRPLGRKGERQIDCGGGLSDAALPRGDGNDVLDSGNELYAALHGVG